MDKTPEPELRAEYDFSDALRGKHHKRYVAATNIVLLAPDVARRFPTSDSVNEALRSIRVKPSRSTGH